MSKFSGCLGKDTVQHRRCKVSNDTGSRCDCDCEGHGEDYVPHDFKKDPLHMVLIDLAVAHGIIDEETMMYVTKGDGKKQAAPVASEDTLEQLEEKRK